MVIGMREKESMDKQKRAIELSLILEPLRSVCDGSRPLCSPPSIIPDTMHVASSRSVGLQDSSWCIMRGGVGTSREVRFAGL